MKKKSIRAHSDLILRHIKNSAPSRPHPKIHMHTLSGGGLCESSHLDSPDNREEQYNSGVCKALAKHTTLCPV